jgi:hypothetical protein
LDIAVAIRAATDARRCTTNMERVVFALVANRAVAPMSKLSAAEWVREDVVVPGLSTMDEDQAYRAMAAVGAVVTQSVTHWAWISRVTIVLDTRSRSHGGGRSAARRH